MKELDWRGYYDPEQPLIYIAGPYNAPTKEGAEENIRKACEARDRLIAAGWSVICPHANTAYMDNEEPGVFYRMDLTQVARCDAIYMLDGWEDSVGAMMELGLAEEKRLVVFFEKPLVPCYGDLTPTPDQYRELVIAREQMQRVTARPLSAGQVAVRNYDARIMKEMKELGMLDETVTNELGGKQSRIDSRLSLLPPEALLRVGAILTTGAAKYGDDNWRLIAQRDHIDHALRHIVMYLSGDTNDDHLGNAACRMLFAISELREGDE